jgi:hypothetical protein
VHLILLASHFGPDIGRGQWEYIAYFTTSFAHIPLTSGGGALGAWPQTRGYISHIPPRSPKPEG